MWISAAADVPDPWNDVQSFVFEHFFAIKPYGLTPDDEAALQQKLIIKMSQGYSVWDTLSQLNYSTVLLGPTKERYTLEDAQRYIESSSPSLPGWRFFHVTASTLILPLTKTAKVDQRATLLKNWLHDQQESLNNWMMQAESMIEIWILLTELKEEGLIDGLLMVEKQDPKDDHNFNRDANVFDAAGPEKVEKTIEKKDIEDKYTTIVEASRILIIIINQETLFVCLCIFVLLFMCWYMFL
ncbi:unnamed protein product, partial [Mesorhabditis belari]|uniref:Uncharacterized protein n=1 Tax=Mesorhabditis belari TaxID=2138241 RepID=A0AAF3EF23_9BILA